MGVRGFAVAVCALLLMAGCAARPGGVPVLDIGAPAAADLESGAPGPASLADVQFLTPSLGWAAGERCTDGVPAQCSGVVLSTVDGGAHWSALAAPPSALDGVQFTDARDGWVWGPSGAYATADGGRTWSALRLPAGDVTFVEFDDGLYGWAWATRAGGCTLSGCPTALYATADGGRSWVRAAGGVPPGSLRPGGFSGERGWIYAPSDGSVYVTVDGGRTWAQAAQWGAISAASGGAWAAAEAPRGTEAQIYRSADGGGTWTLAATVDQYPTGLAAIPGGGGAWVLAQPMSGTPRCDNRSCATEVMVIGAAGAVGAVHSTGDAALLRLDPLTASEAWAVGSVQAQGDTLLHTVDGGQTWQVAYRTGASEMPGAFWGFWNTASGWAIGAEVDGRQVLRTSDGGRTWTQAGMLPAAAGAPVAAGMAPSQVGWVLTEGGHLLLSADGGRQWPDLGAPHVCGSIQAMGFFTARQGWLLAGNGYCATGPRIYRTGDGGRTWQPLPPPAKGTFSDLVRFSNARDGWAMLWVGSGVTATGPSELVRTTDGGRRWRLVATVDQGAGWQPTQLDPGAGGVWVVGQRVSDQVFVALDVGGAGRVGHRFAVSGRGVTGLGWSMPSAGIGWMKVGGDLFETADGGAHWRVVAAG